ncbi:hypothetical protein Cci01nite_80950 [Catellatospora citrea]|uniref:Uncharacterized protein n=2 Tax=Catellatospora citrea TaxID=53366 RepID=A0A8J3P443_9ACTN|nr:hypothetical protein Cci01nite_80950 [Catellatospora citrea]
MIRRRAVAHRAGTHFPFSVQGAALPRIGSRSIIVAIVVLLASVLTPAQAALADHDGWGIDPDNRTQYVKKIDFSSSHADAAVDHGKAQLERSVITTGWGDNDIEVFEHPYGNTGWTGLTDCTDWNVLLTSCNVIRIRFNHSAMVNANYTHWRSLGCHEFGHSGDLGHRDPDEDTDNNSCMRENIWPENFDSHDLTAIDIATA